MTQMKENNSKSITLYYDLGCKRDRENGLRYWEIP